MRRLYIPSDYVDEVSPPGRAHPSQWIAPYGAGHALDAEDPDPSLAPRRLMPGDIVDFAWVENHGTLDVSIRRDGTYAQSRPVPQNVNCFWDESLEVLGDNLGDLVRNCIDVFGDECFEEPIVVLMSRWSIQGEPPVSDDDRVEIAPHQTVRRSVAEALGLKIYVAAPAKRRSAKKPPAKAKGKPASKAKAGAAPRKRK